ncbi:class I SAM-dependent methyltransferase [Microbulbifer sp. OS29]|uniref:Class I SAM-dependent methyltransferase n=1 Tax=Microbulbifer okhotskensis TaxID=2926617 RepID=A0A9X2EW23_9GAMM|nr:methyltransferase domain-containing protein [Microbulbifer okhotskensis]MCO1336981.1 class I SAM-dependent methyltransferase [Microbulbifer okhotskensis]
MDYLNINKISWDKRAKIHVDSEFYDVEGFLGGGSSLQDIEIRELGEVSGKTLLHLQCHFGLDTLSWARLGADVTGVDLSSVAIDTAKLLSLQLGLESRFICADLYRFGDEFDGEYDVVFTSYGALCWLPDIHRWAATVARCLKPGGTFYIAEFHPFYDIFFGYSYFHLTDPDVEEAGTYTENGQAEKLTLATWAHPISDVVNALIEAGIEIIQLNEYPYSPYNCFDGMEERDRGRFYLSHKGYDIPLIYTIKGVKRE